MAVKEKITTEAEALAIVTANAYRIDEVPYKLRTPAVVKKALAFSTSRSIIMHIPHDQMPINLFLGACPTFGKEIKQFVEHSMNPDWGISVSGFVALARKGTIPNLSKVTDEKILVAIYRYAINRDSKNFLAVPSALIQKVVTVNMAETLVKKMGKNTFHGIENFARLPKNLKSNETVLNAFQESFLRYVKYTYSIKGVEPEYLTDKMIESWLEERPSRLCEVPEDCLTMTMCEIALAKDGSALAAVPENWKPRFYKEAVKTGRGLNEIPEDQRTDMLCTVAVDNNPLQLEFVPEDKKSYALCLAAVDKNCETIQFVPVEKLDDEMMIRFIMSVFNETFRRDYHITGEYGSDKSVIQTVFDNFFGENVRDYYKKEKLQELFNSIIERDVQMYFKLRKFAGEVKGHEYEYREFQKYFKGVRTFDHAVVAAKKDISVVGSFSQEVQQKVWYFFLENKDKE